MKQGDKVYYIRKTDGKRTEGTVAVVAPKRIGIAINGNKNRVAFIPKECVFLVESEAESPSPSTTDKNLTIKELVENGYDEGEILSLINEINNQIKEEKEKAKAEAEAKEKMEKVREVTFNAAKDSLRKLASANNVTVSDEYINDYLNRFLPGRRLYSSYTSLNDLFNEIWN